MLWDIHSMNIATKEKLRAKEQVDHYGILQVHKLERQNSRLQLVTPKEKCSKICSFQRQCCTSAQQTLFPFLLIFFFYFIFKHTCWCGSHSQIYSFKPDLTMNLKKKEIAINIARISWSTVTASSSMSFNDIPLYPWDTASSTNTSK